MDEFLPDWASAPGETIKDALADRGATSADLATWLEETPERVAGLLDGSLAIDDVLAGSSPGRWGHPRGSG